MPSIISATSLMRRLLGLNFPPQSEERSLLYDARNSEERRAQKEINEELAIREQEEKKMTDLQITSRLLQNILCSINDLFAAQGVAFAGLTIAKGFAEEEAIAERMPYVLWPSLIFHPLSLFLDHIKYATKNGKKPRVQAAIGTYRALFDFFNIYMFALKVEFSIYQYEIEGDNPDRIEVTNHFMIALLLIAPALAAAIHTGHTIASLWVKDNHPMARLISDTLAKAMIAGALTNEIGTDFFHIDASSLHSEQLKKNIAAGIVAGGVGTFYSTLHFCKNQVEKRRLKKTLKFFEKIIEESDALLIYTGSVCLAAVYHDFYIDQRKEHQSAADALGIIWLFMIFMSLLIQSNALRILLNKRRRAQNIIQVIEPQGEEPEDLISEFRPFREEREEEQEIQVEQAEEISVAKEGIFSKTAKQNKEISNLSEYKAFSLGGKQINHSSSLAIKHKLVG